MSHNTVTKYIKWFEEISIDDIANVGGKTASLGEMYRTLSAKHVHVPNGFAITADAYWSFLSEANILATLKDLISNANLNEDSELKQAGEKIRQRILKADLPENIVDQICQAYSELRREDTTVAVRSSATAEDLPEASFAGLQETYLNIRSEEELLSSCKRCFASLFTDRAISYREERGYDHFAVALSICVQRMVRSDLASSGVMFTLDTESGFDGVVLINSSYGLGETVVQGAVNPDEFYVFKPTLKLGKKPILQKNIGSKEHKLILSESSTQTTKYVPVAELDREAPSLQDSEILELARLACIIEDHYTGLHGKYTPMDIEWAIDGESRKPFILQARPETVISQRIKSSFEAYHLTSKGPILTSGRAVGDKIARGRVRIIKSAHELDTLATGDVLVTDKTDPDWEPMMKKTSAIITDRGGRTCHAAIVSRELGLPAIVGTSNGTTVLRDGDEVTVSCAEGEIGHVYGGHLDFRKNTVDTKALAERPRTKIMMNLAAPDQAFRLAMIPNDGVGLVRIEFIINNTIKIHPMALIHFEDVNDTSTRREIDKLTRNYSSKSEYFVDKLAQGMSMIAAAFYPKDVIIRVSDFKTNEYAGLIGGRIFEPHEENPMIGFRGASRYYNVRYREGFALECQALKRVRDEFGLTNVKIMIPFCRTPDEGRKVLGEMRSHGLERGREGLEIYVMCEIPSNVALADQFSDIFDGFSIGSNDLTQLMLGIDRDSEILSDIFDERNEAVTRTVSEAIRSAHKYKRKIGICGQAPSDYPDFAAFLVREKIDSISLNPDTVVKTTLLVKDIEKEVHHRKHAHSKYMHISHRSEAR